MNNITVSMLVAALLGMMSLSCSHSAYKEVYPTLLDGRYDSEFPYRNCSAQLEEIGESVKMLNSIAYYRTYEFDLGEKVRPETISPEFLAGRNSVVGTSQAAGTATIIDYTERRVVLLTCAHIVGFADTSAAFYLGANHQSTGYLRSYAIKERQTNYVAVFPEGGELEILAMDRAADVALLGKRFDLDPLPRPQPLTYHPGRAKELEWGSFVYLFGYPTGFKMVTKGIVSSPNRDKRGGFLIDAVFNRGFSGGIALAVRDGVPNFELVGIVKLVSGRTDYFISPGEREEKIEYDSKLPYTGELFVERKTEIDYGIGQAIPIEAVIDFIDGHRRELASKGYVVHFPTQTSLPQ